ncbi:MAG: AMP-binding protein [Burkholderiales bacterium]|jgi:acyl-coenzyme A synthetase/AMP-(fatty) acid ligase|nr:AMP-binding protein [Burkholderiales bacterium]
MMPTSPPPNALALSRELPRSCRIALYGNRSLTLADVETRIAAWQATLRPLTQDRLVLFLSDTLEFSAALIAAMREHKTAHLPTHTLPASCDALKSAGLSVFVGDFDHADIARAIDIPPIVCPQESSTIITVPSDARFVLYTSGSTGQPQAVPKRVTQLTRETESLESLFAPMIGDAWMVSTVSHQHIYGLLFKVFWTLLSGRTMVVPPLNFPEELLALTARHRCALISSPAHLKRFCESPLWEKSPFEVSAVFSSGGALDHATAKRIKTLTQHAPIEIYGSTETGGIAWRQQSSAPETSWQPLPHVTWKTNEDGVLCVRSPHLYDDSWWTMSDRVKASQDHQFILAGRVDRIIKLEEKKIALDAIEDALRRTDLIAAARVIPVEMDHHQRICLAAFVVLNQDGTTLLAQKGKLKLNRLLRQHLAASFERIALPRMWRYLEALPVNMQGKTTYAELKALLDPPPASGVTLPFCKVLSHTPRQCCLQLTLPENLIYFDGHFDRAPILPGVAQVNWAIVFGRQYLNLPDTFGGMRQLKFQNIMKPNDVIHLDLSFDSEKSILFFRYFLHDTLYTSGQILISPPHV